MAQGVATAVRDACSPEGIAHHAVDGVNTDRFVVWRYVPDEHGSIAADRTFVADVVCECLAGGRQQWQHVLAARLGSLKRDGAMPPVDVVKSKSADLADTQAQVERQPYHGVAALG